MFKSRPKPSSVAVSVLQRPQGELAARAPPLAPMLAMAVAAHKAQNDKAKFLIVDDIILIPAPA
ncbi:MAG: hypothetical protein JO137_04520 [Hyphomicrobiales bacterium]|nr:hypothetical protein [Hyphomicrobiales bacterium]